MRKFALLILGTGLLAGCATRIAPAPTEADFAAVPVPEHPMAELLVPCEVMRGAPRTVWVEDAEEPTEADALEANGEEEVCYDPCAEPEHRWKIVGSFGYSTARGGGGGVTLGLDFEYRISRPLAVAVFTDWVAGDISAFAGGVGLMWFPSNETWLMAGPGMEYEEDEKEWKPIFRLGGGLEVEMSRGWSFSPTLFFDVRGDKEGVFVFAMAVGKAF